jgi:hypothetical protein
MIDHSSYWIGGMGLHSSQLLELETIILTQDVKNIVEFGSGQSSRFFSDLKTFHNLDYSVTSFDHNRAYAFDSAIIRYLVSCDDEVFSKTFEDKQITKDSFSNAQHEKDNFRVKNCFYDLTDEDLPDDIDLVVLDGPNGNGRSLAFPHLVGKLKSPCYVMIDDVNHYDFLDRAKQIFDYDVITHIEDKEIHPLFSYAVIRID